MSDYNPNQGYSAPPPSTGLAIGSLVVGIIALLLSLIPFIGFLSWLLGPAGLIMGVLAVNKPVGKGLAIGGIVTSILAIVVCILWVVGVGAMVAASGSGY